MCLSLSLIHKHTQVIYRITIYPSVHQSTSQPVHPHLTFITNYCTESSEMVQENGMVWLFNSR